MEKEDDDSIHTQITLLKNYIAEQSDLELSDTYIDNGFTGTRFDRPDFVRMMDDVRCGKIQCIVVKDLSRFGRDFLETGYYIETLLPRLNVRLISINDDFDSFREGGQFICTGSGYGGKGGVCFRYEKADTERSECVHSVRSDTRTGADGDHVLL